MWHASTGRSARSAMREKSERNVAASALSSPRKVVRMKDLSDHSSTKWAASVISPS